MEYTEQDVRAAAGTPIKDIFSELRDNSSKFKTSAILVGSLLPKVQQDKSYKDKGYKSYNDYVISLGLSLDMADRLVQIATTLEQKFPESYKSIRDGVDGSYYPSKKAMLVASKTENPSENLSKPIGISKLKEFSKLDEPQEISIDKLAKSSKIFTKKVLECEAIPDKLKSDMTGINSKIQELKV